jgi:hypothetical protein
MDDSTSFNWIDSIESRVEGVPVCSYSTELAGRRSPDKHHRMKDGSLRTDWISH